MRPTQHISNNRVLGAPKGWDQNDLPCGALPITDGDLHGVQCVHSFWMPDAEELAALNAGQPVVLSVLGSTMPPVLMMVEAKP